METAFARHPLYAGSTREELDSAVEVRVCKRVRLGKGWSVAKRRRERSSALCMEDGSRGGRSWTVPWRCACSRMFCSDGEAY